MQETWVQFPGWEDPLEKGMATHSSILAQIIPLIEEPDGLQSMGSQRARYDWATNIFSSLLYNNHLRKVFENTSGDLNYIKKKWEN